ncbi:hypothetical protein ACS0TY_008497 [Phlomoides rotata]
MGEQFNAHIETLHERHPQSPTQTLETPPDSTSQSLPKSADSSVRTQSPTSGAETSHAAVTGIAHSSQNPCKIPIRPRKIRKFSDPSSSTNDKPSPLRATPSSAVPLITTCNVSPTTTTSARNRRRSASQALPQVIKRICADGEVELALRHLRAADPSLTPLINTFPPPHFDSHISPFVALTKSILFQQQALKAGTSIYMRFVSLCGSEDSVCPDSVLSLSSLQLKQIGVSGRKASYLHDLSNKYKSGILSDDMVVKMDDRSLITMLSMVKGIGTWSIHMFMIFSLQRPDVLPVSDLGVRKGVQLLCGLEEMPTTSQLEQLCEKWRPYRSVGAWYMWQLVEGQESPIAGSTLPLEGNMMDAAVAVRGTTS